MRSFTATVSRESDRWWIAEVEGMGVTQGRDLDQLYYMVLDMITLVADVNAVDVEITMQIPCARSGHGSGPPGGSGCAGDEVLVSHDLVAGGVASKVRRARTLAAR